MSTQRASKQPVDDFVRYWKMNGLGNDFIIVDLRGRSFDFTPLQIKALSDRKGGIGAERKNMPDGARAGCDQFITITEPIDERRAPVMSIWNSNGRQAGACGNASRCVADLLMTESGKDLVKILAGDTALMARRMPGRPELISVDMGTPRLEWGDIPLKAPLNTMQLPIEAGPVSGPAAVSMGNPHMVFFVEDVDALNVAELGAELEFHPLFPNAANVGFAQVLSADRVRLRVFERGAGLTLACGTGACAALVSAVRRGLTERKATMVLDGGELVVEWLDQADRVIMTGPVTKEFEGALDLSRLRR